MRAQKFTKEILVASEFGRARSYLTAPNLRHVRRNQILEVKTEMPGTPTLGFGAQALVAPRGLGGSLNWPLGCGFWCGSAFGFGRGFG